MATEDFVHLHLHSDYSLLDGAIQHGALAEQAQRMGFKAMAVTDHGNMFGAMGFANAMNKVGVKPIIGMEAYVARGSRHDRGNANADGERGANHLILLATDETGYKNLVRLASLGYTEGYYYHPRIDKEVLHAHREGLIALSACMSGVPASLILRNQRERAVCEIGEYNEIFGRGRYFLELQRHRGLEEEQARVNRALTEIAARLDVPLVVTNDAHFLTADDHEAHRVLLCLKTGKPLREASFHYSPDHYVKSPQEMWALWGNENPEALRNTARIADMCAFEFGKSPSYLPVFPVPEGFTLTSYFEGVTRRGLEKRLRHDRPAEPEKYQARLEYEIGIIERMGYEGYFLIVWDFIRHAREQGIPVGPGRGSAAGSLVAYALHITDVDPIAHDLLFERFLNPERVSMPDIDVDFCMRGRGAIIEYVSQFYGRENVSQIATFGTMASRAVIKDVGRALEMRYPEVEKIAKLIPPPQRGRNVSIDGALKIVPELKEAYDNNPEVKRLIDLARRLEGGARHSSIHAAGVVISPRPVHELVPIFKTKTRDRERGEVEVTATQYNMNDLEKAGMLKMDFLGLTTLTIIEDCLASIERETGARPDLTAIPADDPAALKMFSDGATDAVFQFEGDGISEIARRLKPSGLEDIVALNALYRPGPLDSGMVDDYIERRHGRRRVTYDFKELKPVLENTYGVPVFQEQIMAIFQRLAGYSLGEADLVRRAMGKKKREELDAHKAKFIAQAVERGHDRAKLEKLWQQLEGFADYAFNKCVTGDATVRDAVTGELATVAALAERAAERAGEPFKTYSWDGQSVVVNELVEAFPTGEKEIVEVELEDGRTLRCTLDHKFYTRLPDGSDAFLPLRRILERGLALYACDEPLREQAADAALPVATEAGAVVGAVSHLSQMKSFG
ncbi:MAG: DNA polymerase III subunit alpha [Chloracidobacterium sp. CP2_5A]|nr:MAG: DNA polymerase III subunit alpha [Chloracidobacterium sp. CP2_5A]